MKEAAMKTRLGELCEVIRALPSAEVKKGSTEGVYCSQGSTKDQSIEESLGQLRLQIKYLLFDLEATRRENRYLRHMLDNRNRPKSDGFKDTQSDF